MEVTMQVGSRVKVVGEVADKGRRGVIEQVAPSGHYYGVRFNRHAFAYFHESDLQEVK